MPSLQTLWNNYLTSRQKNVPETQLLRLKFINAFSLVGITSFLIFGLMNALGDNAHTGFAELFFAFIAMLNVVYLRGSRNVELAATVIIVIMITALGLLFITGGFAHTGWLWMYTLPPLAFFLKGKRRGWWYLGGLFLLLLLLALSHRVFGTVFAYSYTESRQFLISSLAPIFLIYFYVELSERQNQELEERRTALEITNDELHKEIEKRSRAEALFQKQNRLLEDVKTATLNILEDLKKEKEAVETANLKNEALVASIGEGIIAVDEELRIIAINHAAEQTLALEHDKIIGRIAYNLWNTLDETGTPLALKDRPMYRALQGKKISSDTYTYVRTDGEKIPIHTVATPIRLGGKIIGVIEVFRDSSKEREIDRAKTEFVSLASHQLRTPLTATKWSAELLSSPKTGPLTTAQKKLVHNIYGSNERMIELINALLNVSRIDMGKFAIEPTPTNLISFATSIVEELGLLIKKKGLHIEKKYDKTIPKLNLDPQLMRSVLYNLLTNAIKYTPPKGTITITIAQEKKSVVITIADTGYGIPKNQQDKIFSKLFRADNIRTKETEGTGLGLYIVKSIIDRTGGTVRFESEENKGTTFYITLPLTGMTKREGTKKPTE